MTTQTKSLALVAFAIVMSGCGGGSSTPSPAPAGPQTWQLVAGGSTQQEALQSLSFYSSSLTIDAGDTVTWAFPAGEAHTVTFLGPRATPPPPSDPTAAAPAGGSTYDGTAYTSSGFVLLGKTYALTFPTPGTYKYYCLLHGASGMVGTIVVQNAGAAYPMTQNSITSSTQTQMQTDLTLALGAVSQFPYAPGGPHVAAGMSPGLLQGAPSSVTVLRFLNGGDLSKTSVTVAVGATVSWTNLSTNEPHTVTFGPAGMPFPTMSPFSPPSGGTTYDGSTLVNSGVMTPGTTFSLTFTKAGSYTYHCLFHDDTENMIGTVVVQ